MRNQGNVSDFMKKPMAWGWAIEKLLLMPWDQVFKNIIDVG
jgi:hypothetical protein